MTQTNDLMSDVVISNNSVTDCVYVYFSFFFELQISIEMDAIKVDQSNSVVRWTDRERVLLLCSRGSLARTRHLVNDLKRLMPHVHGESKYGKNGNMADDVNEMCELSNCTKCLYFESRKKRDVYLWASNPDGGPSAKFLVHNMHTMSELNLMGNCLKGSRPIVSFDPQFDERPHLKLIKELFVHIFKTPNHHPRSQPFIDHVINFAFTDDGNIWFRNYQIGDGNEQLQEIGPRFVLKLIRVFDGSFCGEVQYDNPDYQTPNLIRRQLKLQKAMEMQIRQDQKEEGKVKEAMISAVKMEDPIGEVFDTEEKEEESDGGGEQQKVKKRNKAAAKTLERKILKRNRKRKAMK